MRFEIVTGDAAHPYRARLRADNGEIVWWTENYADKRGARDAIALIAPSLGHRDLVTLAGRRVDLVTLAGRRTEIVEIDERTP